MLRSLLIDRRDIEHDTERNLCILNLLERSVHQGASSMPVSIISAVFGTDSEPSRPLSEASERAQHLDCDDSMRRRPLVINKKVTEILFESLMQEYSQLFHKSTSRARQWIRRHGTWTMGATDAGVDDAAEQLADYVARLCAHAHFSGEKDAMCACLSAATAWTRTYYQEHAPSRHTLAAAKEGHEQDCSALDLLGLVASPATMQMLLAQNHDLLPMIERHGPHLRKMLKTSGDGDGMRVPRVAHLELLHQLEAAVLSVSGKNASAICRDTDNMINLIMNDLLLPLTRKTERVSAWQCKVKILALLAKMQGLREQPLLLSAAAKSAAELLRLRYDGGLDSTASAAGLVSRSLFELVVLHRGDIRLPTAVVPLEPASEKDEKTAEDVHGCLEVLNRLIPAQLHGSIGVVAVLDTLRATRAADTSRISVAWVIECIRRHLSSLDAIHAHLSGIIQCTGVAAGVQLFCEESGLLARLESPSDDLHAWAVQNLAPMLPYVNVEECHRWAQLTLSMQLLECQGSPPARTALVHLGRIFAPDVYPCQQAPPIHLAPLLCEALMRFVVARRERVPLPLLEPWMAATLSRTDAVREWRGDGEPVQIQEVLIPNEQIHQLTSSPRERTRLFQRLSALQGPIRGGGQRQRAPRKGWRVPVNMFA
jgi:hypothetical protein